MYDIARRVQRKRDHTESFLTLEHPFLGTSRSNFSSLLQFQETRMRPAAEWFSGSIGPVEIVTYLQDGTIEIEDETGQRAQLESGVHYLAVESEGEFHVRNLSANDPANYWQVWLDAGGMEIAPASEAGDPDVTHGPGGLVSVASGQGETAGVRLSQDVAIYLSRMRLNENLIFETLLSRRVFLAVTAGLVRLGEDRIQQGDSAMIWTENLIQISAQKRSVVVLVDLP